MKFYSVRNKIKKASHTTSFVYSSELNTKSPGFESPQHLVLYRKEMLSKSFALFHSLMPDLLFNFLNLKKHLKREKVCFRQDSKSRPSIFIEKFVYSDPNTQFQLSAKLVHLWTLSNFTNDSSKRVSLQ